jgi:hypothetical protein
MSSAANLPLAIQKCFENGFFRVDDPGDAGTISWSNKGFAICFVVSAGAETRVLDTASSFPVGTPLLVFLKTDGGNVTITGSTSTPVVLANAGDFVAFVVSDNNGTSEWRLVNASGGTTSVPLSLLVGTGAAPAASGLLIGGGTTANPNTTATADAKFIELRCETTATSGDNRLAYLRYALEAAGGGEALRAFTNVNANVGTAHGAHISLSFEAVAGGSECSGLGAAVRGTTHIPNITAWAPTGTLYAGSLELYSDGPDSDPAGLTELAVLALSNSGDGTGKADVDTDASVISIQGFTAAAGVTNAISSTSPAEFDLTSAALGIRVKIGSGIYYVPAIPAADWN